jgi:hypothetical protein
MVLNVAETKHFARHLKDGFVFVPVIPSSESREGCLLHPTIIRILKESGLDKAQV